MAKILGLDLGTNSIGWALIDDILQKIIDTGVRVFPEGVNRDTKGAEISKNADRRSSRQMRRMYLRKKYRKAALVSLLIKHQMFPDINQLLQTYPPDRWQHLKNFREQLYFLLNQVDLHPDLKAYFAMNPYELRAMGIEGKPLTRLQLGRVLYQFAQRRGYKESLQSPLEDGKTVMQGKPEEGTLGIEQTKQAIAAHKTLGSALYQLQLAHEAYLKNKKAEYPERIRNRYTLRSMFKQEFADLWQAQAIHHPQLLTEELYHSLEDDKHGILFFQRPLRNQRFLLGSCTFEPAKRKANASSLLFEEYRMYEFINSIRKNGEPLSPEARQKAMDFFNTKDSFDFGELKKKMGLETGNFNYEDKRKIQGNRTHNGLRKIFGKSVWEAMSPEAREQAWQIKHMAQDPEKTTAYVKRKWGFTEKQAADFLKLRLSPDYASLSTLAIRRILPYLKQGKIYNEAVVLAGLQKAFGAARWQQMSATEKQAIEDTVEGLLHTDGKGTIKQKVRQYLADAYKLTEQQLNKLYHHSDVSNIVTTGQFPTEDAEIEKIKNPVVMAALFEVRKLVTALIKEYGHPDEIRVEMARELKAGKAKRDEIRLKQYENEKANNEAKKILDEYNKPHTRTNVRKILLYKEIEKVAGSAVNPFNPAQTFNIERLFEDGYVQIEHIVPYSISLDDSMGNLTLCDADTNRAKGNKTPAQFFGADPAAWEAHKKQIFKILPYQKAKRFVDDRAHQLEGFIQRQLNDTRYIAKFAKEFLKHVCPRVTISQGAATSQLRHVWGLNSLLSNNYVISPALEGECVVAINQKNELVPSSARLWQWSEGDKINKASEAELRKMGRVLWGYASQGTFYPYKSRDDHRHHAVDALVIACTKTSYLQQLSTYNARVGYEAAAAQAAQFPVPWPTYYNDCRQAINAILVSNKKQNKVLTKVRKALFDKASGKPLIIDGKRRYGAGIAARGALHKATLFGRYINQNDANPYYHIRKRLDKLSGEQLGKIVDPVVQQAVLEAIKKVQPDANPFQKKFEIPKGAFFEKAANGKMMPKVFLPNKNGAPIPVIRVRIKETKSNAVQLKDYNVWVEPGNNYELIIFENEKGKREGKLVPFWEAVEQNKLGTHAADQIPGKIIMRLQKDDMVLLDVPEDLPPGEWPTGKELQSKLYYLKKFSAGETAIEIIFMKALASGLNADKDRSRIEVQSRTPNTFKGIKVQVSLTGKLQQV